MRSVRSVIFGAVVALVLVASQAQLGAAQGTGTIELHTRLCPGGEITDIFGQCHDNLVEQAVAYSLDGGAPETVDPATGNLSFTGLAAGTYDISETEGIPLEFANLKIFCSVQDADPDVFEVVPDGPDFTVELGEGEHLVCDVYNIPVDLSGGETPTPAPTSTAAPVATSTPGIQLPNTGSGLESGSGMVAPIGLGLVALLFGLVAFAAVRRPKASRI
jgi:hypothetical protein